MLVVRALKINQLTDGGMPPTYDSMHEAKRPALQFLVMPKGSTLLLFGDGRKPGRFAYCLRLTKLVTIHLL